LIENSSRSGKCRKPKDNSWGSVEPVSGPWPGVLGEVSRGEADIAFPYYLNILARHKVTDASYSLGSAQ